VVHTAKAPLIRNIVNQQYAHRSPVVSCRDGSKSLLARCVPYLQLDALAVEVYRADLEVDTDRSNEGGCETVFGKAEEAARLADTGVAY
jgi:hypothetical protein